MAFFFSQQGAQGAPGANGRGVRAERYNCGNGKSGFTLTELDENGTPGNSENICPGADGAPGLNGRNGVAKGWLKNFGSAAISSTASNVLSQSVSGGNGYVVNAKVNAPFGNSAKMVQCSLVAVEGTTSTVIDGSETHLIGSSTVTARGVIALGGVYKAQGGEAAGVTINLSCSTGGDSRTLTKGAMNIVATHTIN